METKQLVVAVQSVPSVQNKRTNQKTLSITQTARHLIQIAGFVLMPGLFILALGSFKGLWQAILAGNFTWSAMGAPLITLLAVIPITALWGRFFCGYLCAFGGMQELISFIAKKLKITQLKISPEADRIMRKAKYAVLAVLFLLWTFSISYDFISPWSVFGQYSNYKGWSDLSGWMSVGGQLLIAVMLFSLVVERGFCRYFCPLGGVFSLISRQRLFKVKSNGKCVGCGRCDAECPMGVNVSSDSYANASSSIKSSECIDCFRCIEKCGTKALYTSPREAVAGSAAAIAIAGVYKLGTVTVKSPIADVTGITSASQGQYIDGTYEGSAQGYRGEVKVQVVVSGGVISSITVESYRDDDDFFNRAKDTVISEIISGQTVDVQTVSGATYSSRGIIQAVANALGVTPAQSEQNDSFSGEQGGMHEHGDRQQGGMQQHGKGSDNNGGEGTNGQRKKNRPGSDNGSHNGSRQKPGNNQNSNTEPTRSDDYNSNQNSSQNASLDFKNLTDGTFSGSGQGRNGNIEVTVKVKNGKVTSITVESSNEDAKYINSAQNTVISEIIGSQSLSVDTVSGATMSSNGIIDAVANALGIEYTNPNSQRGTRGQHSH